MNQDLIDIERTKNIQMIADRLFHIEEAILLLSTDMHFESEKKRRYITHFISSIDFKFPKFNIVSVDNIEFIRTMLLDAKTKIHEQIKKCVEEINQDFDDGEMEEWIWEEQVRSFGDERKELRY